MVYKASMPTSRDGMLVWFENRDLGNRRMMEAQHEKVESYDPTPILGKRKHHWQMPEIGQQDG